MIKFTPTSNLKPGMVLAQTILGIQQTENYKLGTTLTPSDIKFLEEKGLMGVYIFHSIPSHILSPDLLLKCLTAVKKFSIDSMFPLAKEMVEALTACPLSLDFKSIRSYEDYLPHHSVCVAVYSVAIGIRLRLPESQLISLALAGLLHDIGKRTLSPTLLTKKESLSPEEYELIKHHPEDGYNLIQADARIPSTVKDAILHHHENMNGTGYPSSQNQDEISTFARILHVADVYDAIMAKRPYKNGLSNSDAIHYLSGGKNILFDEQIVDTFLKMAIPYPTGIEVRLSNKQIGLVAGQTSDNMRPIVYIEATHRMVNLATDNNYQDVMVLSELAYENAAKEAFQYPSNEQSELPKRKKILIVDDAFISLTHTKHALGPNYDVVTCNGGAKAARTVVSEKPDLILMDYEMPDMDGETASLEIQKLGYNIPIIFLTGNCDKETVYACKRCGAVDYILKPANPVYLRTRVEMALSDVGNDIFS